ncbi:cyclic AMP-responsive element-binding protein 3-like protein 3-B isoform X2 [Callorhinchus milii]|uniref:cyclic AMP-responsive element-binding protein 3-like protein 3-B isoform X2 n=2 Tax=Callorhinchus milii TaxID=7868 RepID=UPI001C3F861E|nr:cyclic AMP-responsive element-binding protein 3-like protein 3-B isoform X2 [Callorhinchus milii]
MNMNMSTGCLPPDLDNVDLLDLLFDQEEGILWNQEFETGCRVGTDNWAMAEQSIMNNSVNESRNEELLNSILANSVPDSPQWSPAASDSGISEDHHSDQMDSPPYYMPSDRDRFSEPIQPEAMCPQDTCHPVTNLKPTGAEFPDMDVSIGLGDWNSDLFDEETRSVPTRSAANNLFPLTVKDLLLASTNEMQQQQQQQQLQELVLNEDEKKLLVKEGILLPSQLPLSKYEERVLKKIRRKIRNKQSAQESRKKKKEYIDGLESRMAACTVHNHELQRKVIQLEKHNTTIMAQLRKLQSLIMHSSSKTAQTGTCIMVLLLSFGLVIFPSITPFSKSKSAPADDFTPLRVFSRSLHDVEYSRVLHVTTDAQSHPQRRKTTNGVTNGAQRRATQPANRAGKPRTHSLPRKSTLTKPTGPALPQKIPPSLRRSQHWRSKPWRTSASMTTMWDMDLDTR